jgi:hypothetical protein
MAAGLQQYNTTRPRSSLGSLPTADYAKLSILASQRDGTLGEIGGSSPVPLRHGAKEAQNRLPTLLTPG